MILHLWKEVGINHVFVGDFIPGPQQPIPTVISIGSPEEAGDYFPDPQNPRMYWLRPAVPDRAERVLKAAMTMLKADEIAMGIDGIEAPAKPPVKTGD